MSEEEDVMGEHVDEQEVIDSDASPKADVNNEGEASPETRTNSRGEKSPQGDTNSKGEKEMPKHDLNKETNESSNEKDNRNTSEEETQKINIMTSSEESKESEADKGKTKFYLVKTSTGSFLVPMSAEGTALNDPDNTLPPHVAAVLNQANANRLVNQTVCSHSNKTVSSEGNQGVSSESNQTVLSGGKSPTTWSGYETVSEVDTTNKQVVVTARRIDLIPRSGAVTRRRAPYITQTRNEQNEQFAAEIAAYNKEMHAREVSRSRSVSESSTRSRTVSESEPKKAGEQAETESSSHIDDGPGGSGTSVGKKALPSSPEKPQLKRASVGNPDPSPPRPKQAKPDETPLCETSPILETLEREIKTPEKVPEKPKTSTDRIKELKERLRKQQEKLEEVRKRNIAKVNLEEFDDI